LNAAKAALRRNIMQSLIRQEIIQTARTVVIKVGTSVLSNDDDSLDVSRNLGDESCLSRAVPSVLEWAC
jgi:hypothetical protein